MKKRVKPIGYDIHFEYACPNLCGNKHWLSLKECQEKNFKVVCSCGEVFKPKQIKDISINFLEIKPKINETTETTVNKQSSIEPKDTINSNVEDLPLPDNTFNFESFINECIITLCSLGFEQKEAKQLLKHSYDKCPTTNSTQLIKQTLLDNFGGSNHVS